MMDNRLREIPDLLKYHREWTERFAEHDVRNVFGTALADLETVGLADLAEKRVLDVGCGPRYGFALQCAARGARVTAVDTRDVRPAFLPMALWRAFAHDGPRVASKTLLRRVVFDRAYYSGLERAAGTRLRHLVRDIDFIVASGGAGGYNLPGESFELIAAIAVLEHIPDLAAFAGEVRRLLVPGGLFYAIIHNYYSLSGGHSPDWAFPDERPSERVPPWDHLRERRFVPSVYLNELRPDEYRATLARELNVLAFEGRGIDHRPGRPEGERFLTGDVAHELRSYPRDLLLTRSWCAICQRAEAD